MHILLTRQLDDCYEMILKLKNLGHKVSHLPTLNVEKIKYEKINYSEYSGIIFTSANAVKLLDTKKIDKKIFCFCVGNATEKKTRSLGFQNVISASGSVENLKELILQNFDKKRGKLIYLSGEIISANLDRQLVNEGYDVKRIVNYRTKHLQKFDQKFTEDLKPVKLNNFIVEGLRLFTDKDLFPKDLTFVSKFIYLIIIINQD